MSNPVKTHSVAIVKYSAFGRAIVYIRPGLAAYRDWFTVYQSAADFATVGEAQEWLTRVIGYPAEDYEIYRNYEI